VNRMMNVVIIEKNAVMREKIAELLYRIDGIGAISQLSNGGRLADLMLDNPPQIILLDAGLAYSEQDNLMFLKHASKDTRIIALAEDDRELFVLTGAVEKVRIDDVIMKKDVFDTVSGLVRKMTARDNDSSELKAYSLA